MKFDEDSIKTMLNTGYYIHTVTENIWIDDIYAFNAISQRKRREFNINQSINSTYIMKNAMCFLINFYASLKNS